MDSRTIIKLLQAAGWEAKSQVGSHLHLQRDRKGPKVTVPHPRKDVKLGTVKSIERQSGVSLRG